MTALVITYAQVNHCRADQGLDDEDDDDDKHEKTQNEAFAKTGSRARG